MHWIWINGMKRKKNEKYVLMVILLTAMIISNRSLAVANWCVLLCFTKYSILVSFLFLNLSPYATLSKCFFIFQMRFEGVFEMKNYLDQIEPHILPKFICSSRESNNLVEIIWSNADADSIYLTTRSTSAMLCNHWKCFTW